MEPHGVPGARENASGCVGGDRSAVPPVMVRLGAPELPAEMSNAPDRGHGAAPFYDLLLLPLVASVLESFRYQLVVLWISYCYYIYSVIT